MKKLLLILTLAFLTASCGAQEMTSKIATDKEAIKKVMNTQEQAWSNNDLEGFMQGYWKKAIR